MPPEITGQFRELADLQQAADGTYYAFDRRAHSVHRLDAGWTTATRIVAIGQARGEILQPSAFASAADIFAVSDAPFALDRIQIFYKDGTALGAFQPRERSLPRVTFGSAVMNGAGSLELTRNSVFLSEPDSGSLVSEYGIDGTLTRRFGHLRATGHERDADVHIGLNTGIPLPAADGSTWFVFQAGVPLLRKYDRNGQLQFERHIEGTELDPIVMTLPSSWPRRRGGDARDARELPLLLPNIQAAAVAPDGSLWIATTLPYVYVFNAAGEKTRVVQLEGAGLINPLSLAFSRDGRLLVTPGGYEFDVSQ
ncbi:MAG: hypothetical protein H0X44_02000 [Acidobacteria bacterium]|nr:hypothetical protein [Deltaproteobacteria bacterium]MBA3948701.1 hypothetical protein [Acidobacteriota bacterium]